MLNEIRGTGRHIHAFSFLCGGSKRWATNVTITRALERRKSGRKDGWTGGYKENHRVQVWRYTSLIPASGGRGRRSINSSQIW